MTTAVRRRRSLLALIAIAIAAATGALACNRPSPLRIGTKRFSEQRLLADIVGHHIKRTLGETCETFEYASTSDVDQALKSGRIDMYVEYTGTALIALLGRAVPDVPDKHRRVLEIVRAEYAKSGFEWLVPLGFENTFVLVIRGDEARRQSVTSLSEAAGSRVRWRLGIGQEFKDRKDGLPSLVKTYDLPIAPVPTVLNLTRLYRELEANTVDMISANSTDGLLSVLDVRPLEDDRHFFPPYDAGLVVSTKTLNSRPRLRETLRQLEGKFSPQQMQQMNYLIDGEHREPAVVADTFLRDAGLGGAPR